MHYKISNRHLKRRLFHCGRCINSSDITLNELRRRLKHSRNQDMWDYETINRGKDRLWCWRYGYRYRHDVDGDDYYLFLYGRLRPDSAIWGFCWLAYALSMRWSTCWLAWWPTNRESLGRYRPYSFLFLYPFRNPSGWCSPRQTLTTPAS